MMTFQIVKIIARHEPLYMVWALPQIILNSALTILYVYFPKLIIEQLTTGNRYPEVIKIIVIYSGILLIINVLKTDLINKCDHSSERFSYKLMNEIGNLAMQSEFQNIESASFREVINLANNATELTQAMNNIQNIISNIISILGLTYIIVQLDWLFIAIVVITVVVKAIFVRIHHVYRLGQRLSFAKNDKLGNYITDILYFNSGGAKEIRLNNAQDWLMGKVTSWRNDMVSMQYRDSHLYLGFQIATTFIMTSQSLIILIVLASRYVDGIIGVADFTMYFSAVLAISTSLSEITEQIGDITQQVWNVSDYMKLIDIHRTSCGTGEKYETSLDFSNPKITFEEVSFSYPGSDKLILENINITISHKEKLVIVGSNGADKTTFVKLLCKLYRPTSGKITLNGRDIWEIPSTEYYKVIATVFQDFKNFAFSVKENIGLNNEGDDEKILKVLKESGMDKWAKRQPDGLGTYVSKQFADNGIELSGGEEQKLAIARALYKGSSILILDEPTASLDPKAESELYERFFKVAKDRTTVFVSHRLAASIVADKVAVFHDRKIVEYGSHSDLIQKEGIYAKLFRRQSESYVSEIDT